MSRHRVVAAMCAFGVLTFAAPSRATHVGSEFAIAPLLQPSPVPTSNTSLLIRDALLTSNRYFLNTWWNEQTTLSLPLDTYATRLKSRGTLDSEHIRRYSSVALAIAAPLATNAYNPKVTGVDRATAELRVAQLVAILARTHIANVPHRVAWGGT